MVDNEVLVLPVLLSKTMMKIEDSNYGLGRPGKGDRVSVKK